MCRVVFEPKELDHPGLQNDQLPMSHPEPLRVRMRTYEVKLKEKISKQKASLIKRHGPGLKNFPCPYGLSGWRSLKTFCQKDGRAPATFQWQVACLKSNEKLAIPFALPLPLSLKALLLFPFPSFPFHPFPFFSYPEKVRTGANFKASHQIDVISQRVLEVLADRPTR